MQSKAKTVDEYFAELPAERREALEVLRRVIRETLPGVEESMQHGMPAFSLRGEVVCGIASQARNMAFYCCTKDLLEKHRAALGGLDCGKSCIRFRKLADLPMEAIAAVVRDAAKLVGA